MTTPAPKRALVADDEAPCRQRLRTLLESRGIEVAEAKDGREAIEMLQVESYSIAFLDLMMPYADGFEVIKKVRGTGGEHTPYLVLMTAQAQHMEKELTSGLDFLPDTIIPKLAPDEQVEELLQSRGF